MNNARLYEHTDQALARRVEELSALEEIGRELAGTLDVARIADRIVELGATRHGRADGAWCCCWTKQAQRGEFMAQRGYPTQGSARLAKAVACRRKASWAAWCALGQLANVPDVRATRTISKTIPNVRSQLSVPITREGRVSGVITLESHQPGSVRRGDGCLYAATGQSGRDRASKTRGCSASAPGASMNSRNCTRPAWRSPAASTCARSSIALSRLRTNSPTRTPCRFIFTILPRTLFRPAQPPASPCPATVSCGIRPQGMTRRALQQRRPILVGDTHAEPDTNARLVAAGIRSLILVPVISHDQVLGVLNAYSNHPLKFTDADVQLVSALGNQAAAAIENARLFETVAEVRDRLGAILNSSREGVLMFDLAGRVVMANPALERLLGIPRGDIEGRRLDELLLSKPDLDIAAQLGYSASALTALLDQLRAGQQLDGTHDSYQLARPSARSIERSGMPVLDASGGLVGWMITVRDVTEERELQHIRDDLTSMIVHDLRSPLSAILSGL